MAEQFILFFALLLTGYLCKKGDIIDDGMNRSINRFIINIAYPCLIVYRIGSLEMTKGVFINFMIALFVSTMLMAIYSVYAYWYVRLRKFPKVDLSVSEFSIISPNNGFMGFPFALAFLGEYGLLYMIACNLALNIMFFSYGIHLMTREKRTKQLTIKGVVVSIIKLLINPKISAAYVGLAICISGIQIPWVITEYLRLIGGVATPMAMIFIGSTLVGSSIFAIVKSLMKVEIVISKLLILPAVTLAIVYFLPIEPMVKSICILSCAMPVATTVPIFAERFSKNQGLASEVLFLSTIASLVTIPLFLAVISKIF
ncbi:MAG: AEC family transporter [Anaerovoracaceae bacterium]|jgi:predicted permease